MEISVWIKLFVQAVTYISNLFASSSNPKSPNNGGGLQNVRANDAALTLTYSSVTNRVLAVLRKTKTKDAFLGELSFDGKFVCYTLERIAVAIQEGLYSAKLDKSPHLGYVCPHLKVPERDMAAGGDAGIRIHILNEPCQSDGCIGTGLSIDGDALDNSRAAFDRLMAVLPQEFTVVVSSLVSNN